MSTLLGLDLVASAMKLAVGDQSGVSQIASVLLPSDLVRDHKMVSEEAVAQEVKHALREQHMKKRPCAVVIPAESAIVRRLTVPYMSPEQLRVNLPYEFHDFIQGGKDQYFYDYAVVSVIQGRKDDSGKEEPPTLDLLAAATRKETIAAYRRMLRLAGMKLVRAVPECLAYGHLLRAKLVQKREEYRGECAVGDVGEQTIAIDLFLSAPEKGLLFDTQRTVTTLAQVGEIIDIFAEAGVKQVKYALKGWTKGGYGHWPDALPVERSVGKNSDLTALAQKAAELGSTLSLTANFVEADTDTRSYSKRNDVVYLSNYAILTDPDEETFILSPEVIREKYEAFAKEAEKLSVSGLRLERVGQYIPFNYNRGHVWTTEQTLEAYQQMLADARASLGEVSVQGGAIWAAPYADLLTEVPYKDSGFQFTTEAVPFYQLVMHGVRAYTATPGNLSSDLDREMLRWVEMGYMPYFELTWSSTEELMYTDYQSLFTAQYSAWLDKVSAIAADFADGDLHNLRTALMMEHTKISSDLIRVRYDNGMQVYVNYADHDQQADGLTIPAMGYLVTKEGAQ